MRPDIYVLGLPLSLRLNSEQLIYIISGLSLSCRSNSEKRAKFKITADTDDIRPRVFFTEERDRQSRYNVIQSDVSVFIHSTRV